MKYLISLICCGALLMACGKDKASTLKGNWKIYNVNYGGKDISKSSDPTKENGFWFDGTQHYRRFGNEAHQDTGEYRIEGDWLSFRSQQDSLEIRALLDLKNDTIQLVFPMETEDTLRMSLYKMEE
ncbi:MAG: hypothetical protein ACRBFS_05940 [Aureispira sp.]